MVVFILLYTVDAEALQITGFGFADWGMSRNDIIATEGPPDAIADYGIFYRDKIVMGKRATVVYYFEEGCTKLKSSECFFSKGQYSFDDGSKDFSDKIEKTLTKKYGPPLKKEKEIIENPYSESIEDGKKVTEITSYIRYVGKIKMLHYRTVNLYDYIVYGKFHKAGSLLNYIAYSGPYHYKIEQNKNRAEKRKREL